MGILKLVHVSAAAISIIGFLLRAVLAIQSSGLLRHRFVRIAPHIVDSILLVSAIGLVITTHQYPWVHAWLAAKIVALFVYIGLGFLVLRFGRSARQRLLTTLAAVLVFAYMVGVAMTRDPWLGWIS